ncbi:MAG: YraN family protein [Pseudoxanthomonas suwonensis]|nr:YraN family protein [Pseudoxanthomonas suwonensis]
MKSAGGDRRHAEGRRAETTAREHLIAHGLALVAANVRYRGGELDLVMRDGGQLVFVEVRYRRSDAFGGAAASVDAGKQRRLVLAAQLFLQQHPRHAALPCRFDVVTVQGPGPVPELHWIRNAFCGDGG